MPGNRRSIARRRSWRGQGVVVDRQTLARWMGSAAWLVRGLYDLQLKTMHGFERLFCDETPMPVLDPGRGRTRICQFWAHATDDRAWKGELWRNLGDDGVRKAAYRGG
ncbi:IS66 family transposase [Bradyrhizobium liaoningense]